METTTKSPKTYSRPFPETSQAGLLPEFPEGEGLARLDALDPGDRRNGHLRDDICKRLCPADQAELMDRYGYERDGPVNWKRKAGR